MTETPDYRATDPADQPADAVPTSAQPATPEPPAAGAGTPDAAPQPQPQPEWPSPYARQAESAAPEPTTPLPPAPIPPAQPAPLPEPTPFEATQAIRPQQPSPAPGPPAIHPTEPINQPLQSPAGPAPVPAPPAWGGPPPQAQYPAPGWGTMPQPGTPGAPPPPNWATPAPNGLPPYGAPDSALTTSTGDGKRSGGSRLAITVAILAGLIGGGLGAGITYAVKGNGTTTTSSLSGSTSTTTSSGLNTNSSNANQVTAVAAKILPSVVTISLTASDGSGDQGSGIIISSTGEILTNNHVVAAVNSGDTMTVTFSTGKITPAKVLGTDLASDLAVIQASGVSGLTPASLGDSSSIQVGEDVVAVGAPLGLSNTVTSGIISALNRPVVPSSDSSSQSNSSSTQSVLDAIQTDASINPGNSGGPLVDLSGNVIGINSAIATASAGSLGSSGQSGSIGLGFAIPINQAKWIANELIANGKATHSLLGVSVADPDTSATQAGAVVKTVTSGGPADKAGVKVNDVITKVDDQPINSADSLVAAIRSYKPGTQVTLTYLRSGSSATAQVTLSAASS